MKKARMTLSIIVIVGLFTFMVSASGCALLGPDNSAGICTTCHAD